MRRRWYYRSAHTTAHAQLPRRATILPQKFASHRHWSVTHAMPLHAGLVSPGKLRFAQNSMLLKLLYSFQKLRCRSALASQLCNIYDFGVIERLASREYVWYFIAWNEVLDVALRFKIFLFRAMIASRSCLRPSFAKILLAHSRK